MPQLGHEGGFILTLILVGGVGDRGVGLHHVGQRGVLLGGGFLVLNGRGLNGVRTVGLLGLAALGLHRGGLALCGRGLALHRAGLLALGVRGLGGVALGGGGRLPIGQGVGVSRDLGGGSGVGSDHRLRDDLHHGLHLVGVGDSGLALAHGENRALVHRDHVLVAAGPLAPVGEVVVSGEDGLALTDLQLEIGLLGGEGGGGQHAQAQGRCQAQCAHSLHGRIRVLHR